MSAFTYVGFNTLTPEGCETFEKAPEFHDEFKHCPGCVQTSTSGLAFGRRVPRVVQHRA